MKKILSFVPLAVAISAVIIYLFNIIKFRLINNVVITTQVISSLKIYLYIAVIFFILHFILIFLTILCSRHKQKKYEDKDIIKKIEVKGNKYCDNCGEKIFDIDRYCSYCGKKQLDDKKGLNPILKNIINIIEIVILILVIYFSLNMLFEFKEKQDPNFKSPLNIEITK